MAKAILYEASKCTACRGCQVACKEWNELPAEKTINRGTYENPPSLSPDTWVKIKFMEVSKNGNGAIDWLFMRQACLHCSDAPCVELCPSNALFKNEFGFTEIDPSRCIGCGICEKFCPFGVPHVDYDTQKAKKCSFCWNRVANGLEPACVKSCPTGALTFGDRQQLLDYAHQVMTQSKDGQIYFYGEREFGGLNVLYLLPEDPTVYGLPKHPQRPNPFEAYAALAESTMWSPIRSQVLTLAGLKYFGRIYV